ncbi:MAG: HAD hydrolase family protein [Opitutales bacterium]|nr:HAD hydrolase family protein [Opitutales bacterium]
MKKLRICIDLDGTICEIRRAGETYADVAVKAGAAEKIKALHDAGHTIVINTARNMGSTGHNVGLALKNVGQTTFEWLEKHGIVYDEIFFGKPNADITIDDRVLRFSDWSKIDEERLYKEAREK